MKDEKRKKTKADKHADKPKHKKKHADRKGEKKRADRKGEKSAASHKDDKKAKAAAKLSRCTCCKKHCPLSKPKCGKGRRLAAALKLRKG